MLGVALLSSALLVLADARIYGRCELARDFLSLGIKKEHLATWVCIAFHESRFDTAARNPHSGDHGILQISELYWCGAGKACGLPCSALRDEDISDDVECALQIHEEHTRLQGNGFLAWVVYPQHCKHNAKKYLADCESSVKTPPVRTDGRARVYKPQNRNNVTYVSNSANYPQIDELLPPYLIIGSVFSGNYEKQFEENYNNKGKIDWLNYKIDNIDELKLPVFNQKVIGEYTTRPTSTLATRRRRPTTTTTTTTEYPLPKIKPPSPRRIESNSFRRKKLRPIFEPVNFIGTTDSSTIIPSSITPRDIYFSTIENVRKYYNIRTSTIEDNVPITTTTIKPLTKKIGLTSTFAAFTPTATALQVTTTSPTVYTANQVLTTITQEVSTVTTEKIASPKDQNTTVISVNRSSLTNKINPSVSELKTNISANKSVEATSTLPTTSKSPTTAIKNSPFSYFKSLTSFTTPTTTTSTTTWRPWSRTWSNWRTTSNYTTTTTTSKPSSSTRKYQNTQSTKAAQTREDISLKESKRLSTTTNSWVKTRPWFEFKASTKPATKWLNSINNASSTRIPVETTTSKPLSTTPKFYVQSTAYPTTVKSTPSRSISTETPTPTTSRTTARTTAKTTARSTQSIFDLYLRPTKPPTIAPFSFSPFRSGGLSLKIFAGGTTTYAPAFSKSDSPKSALEDTAKGLSKT